MTPVLESLKGEDFDLVPVVIANGASLSAAGSFDAGRIEAIELPTLTSAAVSFQVSTDGSTFRDLYNSDGTTETQLGATTGDRIVAAPQALKDAAIVAVKVRSGLTAATVAQGAARTINLILRAVR